MKLLIVDEDYRKSSILIDHKKRLFNQVIVSRKLLDIFASQPTNGFYTVPNYRVWRNNQEALKAYSNAMLKVCKEIHNINTKYEYLDVADNFEKPKFTDLTFKSHQAFLIEKDPDLYLPKFKNSRGFNGGILIWEYENKNRAGEIYMASEDIHGIYKNRDL